MKKIKLISISALGALVLAIAVLAAVAPKKMEVTTTASIRASEPEVFTALTSMSQFPHWSPFLEADPEQQYYVAGEEGKVGSSFHWKGVKVPGDGWQELTNVEMDRHVEIACHIRAPYTSDPTFSYELAPTADAIAVKQTFTLDLPFPSNVFAFLSGLEQNIAATNQRGLERLKSFLEQRENASGTVSAALQTTSNN